MYRECPSNSDVYRECPSNHMLQYICLYITGPHPLQQQPQHDSLIHINLGQLQDQRNQQAQIAQQHRAQYIAAHQARSNAYTNQQVIPPHANSNNMQNPIVIQPTGTSDYPELNPESGRKNGQNYCHTGAQYFTVYNHDNCSLQSLSIANWIPRTKYVRGILWFSRRYAAAAAASASADTSSFSR